MEEKQEKQQPPVVRPHRAAGGAASSSGGAFGFRHLQPPLQIQNPPHGKPPTREQIHAARKRNEKFFGNYYRHHPCGPKLKDWMDCGFTELEKRNPNMSETCNKLHLFDLIMCLDRENEKSLKASRRAMNPDQARAFDDAYKKSYVEVYGQEGWNRYQQRLEGMAKIRDMYWKKKQEEEFQKEAEMKEVENMFQTKKDDDEKDGNEEKKKKKKSWWSFGW